MRKLATRFPWWSLLLLASAIAFTPIPFNSTPPSERTLRIEASSFAYQPAVLAVNPGDKITLELVSSDVVHGIYLDGYDLEVSAEPGQTAYLTFLADRPGSFRMRCSVTCGPLHPFMIGKLQVGTNWSLWRLSGLTILAALAGLVKIKHDEPGG